MVLTVSGCPWTLLIEEYTTLRCTDSSIDTSALGKSIRAWTCMGMQA
jgi:hypothetical protein